MPYFEVFGERHSLKSLVLQYTTLSDASFYSVFGTPVSEMPCFAVFWQHPFLKCFVLQCFGEHQSRNAV
eukprot:3779235-Amphidinium_carterae.1